MITRRKTITLTSIAAIVIVTVVTALWQGGKPRKPAEISQGDFTYTLEYTQFRIQQVMEQMHLPSLAVTLIDDQDQAPGRD